MRSPKIMIALFAVSTLGLSSVAVAKPAETGNDSTRQQVTDSTEDVSQRRSERRQTAQKERRSARREERRSDDVDAGDGGSADTRRADRNRPRTDRSDGEDSIANNRRTERRHSADRQARSDRRQARAERNESGRNARWTDHRNNREFNRRDFGRDRGEQRRSGRRDRHFADVGRTKHKGFDRRVDRRLSNQRERTRAGLKNGDLTHRELKRIRRDRHKIARMDRRFGSDGRYTKRERRQLSSALDRASHRVYRAKNNRRVAADSNKRKHRW